ELVVAPNVCGGTDAQHCELTLARQQAVDEELQQALVAEVDAEVGLGQPVLETASPLIGQAVDGSRASAARSSLTLDEPGCREPAQLGVDLPVACIPKEAGGLIDGLLDLVAAASPESEEPEHDQRRTRKL